MSMDPCGKSKLLVNIKQDMMMPMIQGQLHFECGALSLDMYCELVHWLQVSIKAHDGRLTFATLMWSNANVSLDASSPYAKCTAKAIAKGPQSVIPFC